MLHAMPHERAQSFMMHSLQLVSIAGHLLSTGQASDVTQLETGFWPHAKSRAFSYEACADAMCWLVTMQCVGSTVHQMFESSKLSLGSLSTCATVVHALKVAQTRWCDSA